MAQPFKYGANYGGENTNAFSSAAARGAAIRQSNLESEEKRRKLEDEQSNKNAMNALGTMQQTEYKNSMQDPSNRQTFMQDQGLNAAQMQAVETQMKAQNQGRVRAAAIALLGLEGEEFKKGSEYVHSLLTPEEQKQVGDPSKWTRANVAAVVGGDQIKEVGTAMKEYMREAGRTERTTIQEEGKTKRNTKGGSKTQFVQIADWLQNNMTRTDANGKPRKLTPAEVQFEAQKIMSTGKFNEQAAATQLRKAGMSQERITEFMNFANGLGKSDGGQPAPQAPAGNQPPKGAVDTGRTSGGKKVWKLPNGDFWIQASASAPTTLAMNAENVPIGNGQAAQAQDILSMQKQYQEALRNDNFEEAERIKQRIQEIQNSRRNVG